MDQLKVPQVIFFSILITLLLDIVLILKGEVLSWSLMGVRGLGYTYVTLAKQYMYIYGTTQINTQHPYEELG